MRSIVEGYHQYSGGLLFALWSDIFSTPEGANATWRGIIMKVEDSEYRGGLSSVWWKVIICNKDGYLQYSGWCQRNAEGYHHESGRCRVFWRVYH